MNLSLGKIFASAYDSITRRLYLHTAIVAAFLLIVISITIWAGNTLTMITAIARFERTHTVSRVEAMVALLKFHDNDKPEELEKFQAKMAVTQSYNKVFSRLLEMRKDTPDDEFVRILESTFKETDHKTAVIIVNRIKVLSWHPILKELVANAGRANPVGEQLKTLAAQFIASNNEVERAAIFAEIEKAENKFISYEASFSKSCSDLSNQVSSYVNYVTMLLLVISVGLTGLLTYLIARSVIQQAAKYTSDLEKEIQVRKLAEEALLSLRDRLQEQNEELQVNEEEMRCQNDELQSTEEMLRVQINEYETSQKLRKQAEEENIKLTEQIHQAQRIESIGRLAGGVAHDFNNMLTVILGHAEMGLMRLDSVHPVCADLQEISKTAERSADLTRQLLTFARKQTVAPKVLDLNETISGMLKMLQRLIGENLHLTWQAAADLWPIKVDPSQIDQILANLCVNARDAIEDTGRVTIETENCTIDAGYCASNPEASPGEYVRLSVSDDGAGMDKETLTHIFEPFYTTKEMGKGTGLGLATVYGAVKQNNGFINIYSEPGQGTTFSIYLPRETDMGTARRAPTDAETTVPRGQETILLVEDEPAILNIAALMLEKQGYTVLKAETPGKAIHMAQEHTGEIHLLMTDVIMPEMNGRDLAINILSSYPQIKRLFMSGYTADVIAHHGVLDEGVHFIQKPFSLPNMAGMVREVLDS